MHGLNREYTYLINKSCAGTRRDLQVNAKCSTTVEQTPDHHCQQQKFTSLHSLIPHCCSYLGLLQQRKKVNVIHMEKKTREVHAKVYTCNSQNYDYEYAKK